MQPPTSRFIKHGRLPGMDPIEGRWRSPLFTLLHLTMGRSQSTMNEEFIWYRCGYQGPQIDPSTVMASAEFDDTGWRPERCSSRIVDFIPRVFEDPVSSAILFREEVEAMLLADDGPLLKGTTIETWSDRPYETILRPKTAFLLCGSLAYRRLGGSYGPFRELESGNDREWYGLRMTVDDNPMGVDLVRVWEPALSGERSDMIVAVDPAHTTLRYFGHENETLSFGLQASILPKVFRVGGDRG